MGFVVLIVVILVVICLFKKSNNTNASEKNYDLSSPEVGRDFANESIKFFDNYLSLCRNHSVTSVCSLAMVGKDEFGIKTNAECVITAIDNKNGEEAFKTIRSIWTNLRREKMDAGDYAAVAYAGDGYIKKYFGCDDLHFVFTEADEYQFENRQVIMRYERHLFTREGAQWEPTIKVIKQELLKKWPNAQIKTGAGGIIVE